MAFRHPALDLTVAVTTPENISFEYQLAGPFRRLPAMLLDIVIRYAFVLAIVFLIGMLGLTSLFPNSSVFFLVIVILSIFLLSWFYGLAFEILWNGQTPGKRAFSLRVVSIDGRPINGAQATIRNFVRVADFFPYASTQIFSDGSDMYLFPTMIVALVCMLFTKRFQRLGDLAAGTMVIVDERGWRPKKITITDGRIPALAEFIPADFQMTRSMAKTIALYMERRPQMSAARQQQVARYLADPLMERFGFRDDTSPDLLLCALYFREFYQESDVANLPRPALQGSPLRASTANVEIPMNEVLAAKEPTAV